jgi:hypothetical protein
MTGPPAGGAPAAAARGPVSPPSRAEEPGRECTGGGGVREAGR